MRKILSMLLCAVLCVQLTACGGSKNDTRWVEEGAALLADDIRSGEFVLDGALYSFPMDLSDWLDNGWHISNSYDNKDEFELEPGTESTEFELFNENDKYVRVCVYNYSDENATIDKCMVSSLYMSLSEFNVVFPGGMYGHSKPSEVLEAYGEPDVTDDSESNLLDVYYDYTSEGGWGCQVNLHVLDNDYTVDPFTSIEYDVTASPEWNTFLKNTVGADGCKLFIDSSMRASFYGDFDDYVKYGFDTQEGAQELYDAETNYYASAVMYYAGIDETRLDETAVAAYRQLAKEVIAQTEWDITVNLNDDQITGTVDMNLYPTNFFDILFEEVQLVYNEFDNKYAGVEAAEEQLTAMNQEYAEMVLAAVSERTGDIQQLEAVAMTYEIDYANGILNSDNWTEIDNILMDVYEVN